MRRKQSIRFVVNEQEYAVISEAADVEGVSMSQLVRRVAVQYGRNVLGSQATLGIAELLPMLREVMMSAGEGRD